MNNAFTYHYQRPNRHSDDGVLSSRLHWSSSCLSFSTGGPSTWTAFSEALKRTAASWRVVLLASASEWAPTWKRLTSWYASVSTWSVCLGYVANWCMKRHCATNKRPNLRWQDSRRSTLAVHPICMTESQLWECYEKYLLKFYLRKNADNKLTCSLNQRRLECAG